MFLFVKAKIYLMNNSFHVDIAIYAKKWVSEVGGIFFSGMFFVSICTHSFNSLCKENNKENTVYSILNICIQVLQT